MIKKIMNALGPFKKLIITVIILVVVYLVAGKIVPAIRNVMTNKTPIESIEATCEEEFDVNDEEIDTSLITVTAIHEDGKTETLDEKDYTVDISDSTYAEIPVTVTLNSDENISCEVSLAVKKKKIMGFTCGYPYVSDVTAVLYSNGELRFEGEGDVLIFNEYPWLTYEEAEEYPITSVTFEDTVTPTNMNYWFSGLTTLTYVDTIPSSVRTMVGTFENCTSLVTGADWTNCTNLLNINYCYNGCTALDYVYDVPENVRVAKGAFTECDSLQTAGDVSKCESLVICTEMYSGCDTLAVVDIPVNATDISSMFLDCINLKDMPTVPDTVTNMYATFSGCLSLTSLTNIPALVEDTSLCFYNCEIMTGELVIDAEPSLYDQMFEGACVATKINITGSSSLINDMVTTKTYDNIYVNGYKAVTVVIDEDASSDTENITENVTESTTETTTESTTETTTETTTEATTEAANNGDEG